MRVQFENQHCGTFNMKISLDGCQAAILDLLQNSCVHFHSCVDFIPNIAQGCWLLIGLVGMLAYDIDVLSSIIGQTQHSPTCNS
jgi:hypothetical protein